MVRDSKTLKPIKINIAVGAYVYYSSFKQEDQSVKQYASDLSIQNSDLASKSSKTAVIKFYVKSAYTSCLERLLHRTWVSPSCSLQPALVGVIVIIGGCKIGQRKVRRKHQNGNPLVEFNANYDIHQTTYSCISHFYFSYTFRGEHWECKYQR